MKRREKDDETTTREGGEQESGRARLKKKKKVEVKSTWQFGADDEERGNACSCFSLLSHPSRSVTVNGGR